MTERLLGWRSRPKQNGLMVELQHRFHLVPNGGTWRDGVFFGLWHGDIKRDINRDENGISWDFMGFIGKL